MIDSVSKATADELIAAGWGDVERCKIPEDWQTRRPPQITEAGMADRIIATLQPGPLTLAELVEKLGEPPGRIKSVLANMQHYRRIAVVLEKGKPTRYRLTGVHRVRTCECADCAARRKEFRRKWRAKRKP